MAVQLSSNDELARGQFCLDGVDDFENKPCAVFEASSVLNVNIRQPAYPERRRIQVVIKSYLISPLVNQRGEELLHNVSMARMQLKITH